MLIGASLDKFLIKSLIRFFQEGRMDSVALLLANTAFLIIIVRFVARFVHATRGIIVQLIASISCSVLLIVFPPSGFFLLLNFGLFIAICFPVWEWLRASFYVFCTASLVGGLLFVVDSYWPSSLSFQLIIFLVLSTLLLSYLRRQYVEQRTAGEQHNFVQEYTIQLFGERFVVTGFIDTGNECTELFSNDPVHFLHIQLLNETKFAALKEALHEWEEQESFDQVTFNRYGLTNIRFVGVKNMFGETKLSLAFKGGVIQERIEHPCYFVFVSSAQRFPKDASLLLHVSMLAHFKNEGGS